MKTRLLAGAIVAALFAVTAHAQNRAADGTPQINLGDQGPTLFSNRALITQTFEDIAARPDAAPGANGVCALSTSFAAAGWFAKNNSSPLGTNCLAQGYSTLANAANQFAAQAGGANSFAGLSFSATTGANTISVWLVSPVVTFSANSSLEFWTRGITNAGGTAQAFPDRLQVRTSTVGTGTPNVGNAPADVGDFTNLALDLNSNVSTAIAACPDTGLTNPPAAVQGYPMTAAATRWCRIRLEGAAGRLPTSGQGRIAFRYFVPDGGPAGANSFHIGIDSFAFEEGSAPPVTSVPASGSNIALTGGTGSIVFTNPGPAATAVTCAAPAGFTASPSPLNLAANGSGTLTLGIAPGTAPGNIAGVLNCTATGGQALTFNLTATVAAAAPVVSTPVNTLSTYGLGLLSLLLAGVGIAAVRRFA